MTKYNSLEEIKIGKPVNSNVQRVDTISPNMQINKEVLESFKDSCGKYAYPMNVMLEIFMKQYADGSFKLETENILKFKDDKKETGSLGTVFNREIYNEFKSVCQVNGFYMKYVLTAFMEEYVNNNYVLEYVNVETK